MGVVLEEVIDTEKLDIEDYIPDTVADEIINHDLTPNCELCRRLNGGCLKEKGVRRVRVGMGTPLNNITGRIGRG